MSGWDPRELPGGEPDPIRDVFDRERDQVRDLGTPDARWEAVVEGARRPARWPAYLGGVAAAAVVAAVAVAALPGSDGPLPEASGTPSAQVLTAPTGGATDAPTTSSPATPVPAGFVVSSLSTTASGRIYALGSTTCGDDPCAALTSSGDQGRTWTTQSVFRDLPVLGALDDAREPALAGVRFASEQVGYAYGATLLRTADGGRSWQSMGAPEGERVLSLETDGARVWFASAASCDRVECAGPVTVRVTSTGTPTLSGADTSVADTVDAGGQDVGATRLGLAGRTAYLSVFADGVDPRRLGAADPQLPRPQGCEDGRPWVVSPAADDPQTVVAVCATAARDSEDGGFTLSTSGDVGVTWSAPTEVADAFGPVRHGGPVVVATDAQHLVASTGGSTGATGKVTEPSSLVHSSDGGRTWQPATTPSGGDLISGDWGWVGAAGGPTVLAVGPGGGWISRDRGASFAPLDVH